MSGLVLDCSMTMAWCFEDEATAATRALFDEVQNFTLVVPSHWRLEVGNVLALAERKRRIQRLDTEMFLGTLDALAIEEDDATSSLALGRILDLAREEKLTTYDAAYLELALRKGIPLASLDKELRRSAKKIGVKVMG